MNKKKILQKTGIFAFAIMFSTSTIGSTIALAAPTDKGEKAPTAIEQRQSETKKVISETTKWHYLDDGTDPAASLASKTAWTKADFNDEAWKNAAGKFGAKRGELVSFDGFTPTVKLNQYKADEDKVNVPTFFFRTKVNIKNVNDITSITGKLFHDDAVRVFLNGHLIKSVDMPSEEQENNLFYAGVGGGAPKQADINLSKDDIEKYVKEGENVIAVELHNDRETSSDIYFEFDNLSVNYNEEPVAPKEITQKSVFLTVGGTSTSQGLTWYADTEKVGEVQYAVKNGDSFPKEYKTKQADRTIATNDSNFYSNQAVLNNLQPNTEYVYRVVNEDKVSKTYSFKSGDNNGSFSFALVGDPQVGASRNIEKDTEGWNQTVNTIKNNLKSDFVLSAGDQVNTASNEKEYAGYINDAFASLPSATTIGNHDSGSAAYNQHFNLPNESVDKGATTAGTDYWFVYDNTLFMNINSNDRSTAEHKAFMEEAISANPNVKWKTVVFHHSVYSTASHTSDGDIIQRRNELPDVFKELDIDVVLMGHDHVYTRTYVMDGQTPQRTEKVENSAINPNGIIYLTANSASGSKYYDIKAPNADFSAKMDQSKRRTVTDVKVTDSTYTMTTYYADTMEELDTFTIHKTDKTKLENLIKEAEGKNFVEEDYTDESWNRYSNALNKAKETLDKKDALQADYDDAYNNLSEAMEGLTKKPVEKPETDDGNKPIIPDTDGDNNTDVDDNNNQDVDNNNQDLDDNQDVNDDNHQTDSDKPQDNAGSNDENSDANDKDNKDDENKGVQTDDMTNVAGTAMILLASGATAAALLKKKKDAK